MTVTRLDLSGLKCPLPALKTRRALKSLAPGDRLEVRCTDPMAAIDIPHLVASVGDRMEAVERSERRNDLGAFLRLAGRKRSPTEGPAAS